ncbi:MAG: type I polyketide synthase, partial [Arenicellales bacterium]
MKDRHRSNGHIAVIGMAVKVPHASSLDQFWTNLKNGRDCFSRPSRNELERLGIPPRDLKNPANVPSKPLLEDIEYFDADFFDIPDSQAELMDPAHRLFLECVWEAMEHAGEVPGATGRDTGLFAGVDTSEISYLFQNLGSSKGNEALEFTKRLGTTPDYFTLRVANALNLTGPVLTTLATCSTSLMAVHMAAQHLLQGKCSLAIAGGARIELPAIPMNRSTISGMHSLSGYVRPFDADADGTIFGSGVAAVLLKRLGDAIEDGNPVHGVILGSGFCNDGNPPDKLSFTAPAPSGQVRAVAEAIDEAGISPRSIGYVECHGTGTLLGDPTEVTSLTEVFGSHSSDTGYCAIGSVKGNVGHLGSAAGVTSLIKACLAIRHGVIPGNPYFKEPNPEIDFERTPFYVNRNQVDWLSDGTPRRAGVSAFGFGGSNAHLVIEQYIETPTRATSTSDEHLFVVSAKTTEALARRLHDLAGHLEDNPQTRLADVAHTLKHGRAAMPIRTHIVVDEADRDPLPRRIRCLRPQTAKADIHRPVIFLFPGQGSQETGMGQGLYENEPGYRETVDYCAELLEPELGFDLREKIHPTDDSSRDRAEADLTQTAIAQPALFVVEYALAKLYQRWGIKPTAMLGHSLGELVAACLAGVFSLEDGLRMVALRSRLMQQCDPGSMLAVLMPLEDLLAIVPDSLDLAGMNSPRSNVVAGPTEAILEFAAELDEKEIGNRILNTSHAFHSRMLDPTLEEFSRELMKFEYHPPSATVISNVTGVPMTEQQALNPDYWVEQRRQPVRFSEGVAWCLTNENPVFIEVGPGKALSGLVQQHDPTLDTVTSLRDPLDDQSNNTRTLALDSLGKVWSLGGSIDWPPPVEGERKIALPTYPFQRRYIWRDYKRPQDGSSRSLPLRLYEPGWSEQPLSPGSTPDHRVRWLVFVDAMGSADKCAVKLEDLGYQVTLLEAGDRFVEISKNRYRIVPGEREHIERLIDSISPAHGGRLRVLHFWALTNAEPPESDIKAFEQSCNEGFHTLVAFLQVAHTHGFASRVDVQIYANGLSNMQTDRDTIFPEKGNLLGPALVGPREIPGLTMRCIDVPSVSDDDSEKQLSDEIFK